MRRGTVSRSLVALLLVAAGVLVAPGLVTAKSTLLVTIYNEGLEPHAELLGGSRAIAHPKQLRVEFTGSAKEPVEGRFTVKCYRGAVPRFSKSYTISGLSPADRVVRIKTRWDRCRVAKASARFSDPFISGWVQINAYGTG